MDALGRGLSDDIRQHFLRGARVSYRAPHLSSALMRAFENNACGAARGLTLAKAIFIACCASKQLLRRAIFAAISPAQRVLGISAAAYSACNRALLHTAHNYLAYRRRRALRHRLCFAWIFSARDVTTLFSIV